MGYVDDSSLSYRVEQIDMEVSNRKTFDLTCYKVFCCLRLFHHLLISTIHILIFHQYDPVCLPRFLSSSSSSSSFLLNDINLPIHEDTVCG